MVFTEGVVIRVDEYILKVSWDVGVQVRYENRVHQALKADGVLHSPEASTINSKSLFHEINTV